MSKTSLSTREIAREVRRSHYAVASLLRRYRETGSAIPKSRSGHLEKLKDKDKKAIIKKVSNTPLITLKKLTQYFKVCSSTIKKVLNNANVYQRHITKKLFISEEYAKKRLEWCLKRRKWTIKDWRRVIWSDKTSIELFSSRGPKLIWRKPGEKYLL